MPGVLFLDIDGVLNDHAWNAEAESCTLKPECVRAFNRILRESRPKVIVTSAWRYMVFRGVMTWVGFGYMLRTHGVDKLISALIGGTVWSDEEVPTRGEQVARWVCESEEYERQYALKHSRIDGGPFPLRYVVLDDAPPGMDFRPVEGRLVKTDGAAGLTEADADRVIDLLKGQGAPCPCQ